MIPIYSTTILYDKVNGNTLKYTIHLANELQKLRVHLNIHMTVLLEYTSDCSIRVNRPLNALLCCAILLSHFGGA